MKIYFKESEDAYESVGQTFGIKMPSYKLLFVSGLFATVCMIFTVMYAWTKAILFVGKKVQNRR